MNTVQTFNINQRIISKMVKQQLQVFARIKPNLHKKRNQDAYTQQDETAQSKWLVSDNFLKLETRKKRMSNAKEQHDFYFNHIFDAEASQQEVFEAVAKPVIDNCLDGYNGTVFSYGQTGSGKTYTISGGDTWAERGITPRVLSYIFKEFQKRSNEYSYELHVSFIQIYNQNAYDLLDQKHSQNSFQTWTKIVFMQDQDSNLQMKNLKTHICENEKQGIDFLMMGNYIKKLSSNNLNQTSSRSHCIFTLNVKGKNLKTMNQIYSKVHLVDLAGSERIAKSHAQGLLLTEAKSINLSLTYLQQVIVSLNQRAKTKNNPGSKIHVPYRNSLLTTLLKDSLGGNCKTVMIATVSKQPENTEESISTLRFSQRVKQIQNQISKNEMNIYSNKIEKLQKQNQLLKKKIANLEKNNSEQDKQNLVKGKNSIMESEQVINKRLEEFMSERKGVIQLKSLKQAQIYLLKIRDKYNRRMREYVSQLTFIGEKIAKYDEVLNKKQSKRGLQQHQIFNI